MYLHRRPGFRTAAVGLILALVVSTVPVGASEDGELESLRYLPEDALYAASARMENLGVLYEKLLGFAAEFLPEGDLSALEEPLQLWEEEVGLSLHDDLLGLIGGEISFAVAVDDLDRIGLTAMTLQSGGKPDLEPLLGGIVGVVGVDDPERLDESIGKLVAVGEARLELGADGIRTVLVGDEAFPILRYRYHDGYLVAGITEGAVRDALLRAEGEAGGLADSADFQSVFAHLDPDPDALLYLNLPRLQELLRDSNLIQAALATDPTMDHLYEKFVVDMDWTAGIGWGNYPVPAGSVQQTFMPLDLGALAQVYVGAIAAVGVPNLVTAMERGRQKRTMADIRSIGTAVEAYAVDHSRYPPNVTDVTPVGAAEGSIGLLVPVYIGELPSADAWGNPIYYQSDEEGRDYRLLSFGRDGIPSSEAEGPQEDVDDDIIFRNGVFITWPDDVAP